MIRKLCPIILACWMLLFPYSVLAAKQKLDPVIRQVEQRLDEETRADPNDPNSLTFLRAIGESPLPRSDRRVVVEARILTLEECLNLAFQGNHLVKQAREMILGLGGSKLIANSRFLPSIQILSQLERYNDFESNDDQSDTLSTSAVVRQRLLEYGKDNPIDVALRAEQREALFNYENRVAETFSNARRAFDFILLKDRQIATREGLLEQFKQQFSIKQQRMEADNLSVKFEVLTARLNVLNEQQVINSLQREQFNSKMELLQLVGLPIEAKSVTLKGQADTFALGTFALEGMVTLALAQSSDVALAEVLVAEQGRKLKQLKFEYWPDLRATSGYQDRNGRVGADLVNDNHTWGLDLLGQPGIGKNRRGVDGLGLFYPENRLGGPDRGWYTGLQVRLPIFEGRARKGRKIQNRAYLIQLRAALAQSKDQIELLVRQSYKFLAEQNFQVDLAQQEVEIERERFQIYEQLRDVGRIDDEALERFRVNFFHTQNTLFRQQELLIRRQEDLREAIRFFR